MSQPERKFEFKEPVELQEWYDVGADIRINIRLQFSKLKAAVEELEREVELWKSRHKTINDAANEKLATAEAKLQLAVERLELIASMNGRNNGCTYCAGIARETLEKVKS